jgi:hypothetical protein
MKALVIALTLLASATAHAEMLRARIHVDGMD